MVQRGTESGQKGDRNWDVKFDQAGVLAFYKQAPELLANAGFKGITLDVLSDFCSNLHQLFYTVLYTSPVDTPSAYEVNARVLLGFNFVLIFGTKSVTATIKHLVSYMGFYIKKALKDAELVGVPLSLNNFNDGIMETKHKEGKQGNYIYSGGKTGETGKVEYQKRVIEQQFCNEWVRITRKEENVNTSSACKAQRKSGEVTNYQKKKQEVQRQIKKKHKLNYYGCGHSERVDSHKILNGKNRQIDQISINLLCSQTNYSHLT